MKNSRVGRKTPHKQTNKHRKRDNLQYVINSIVISKLIHVGSILPIPEDDLFKKMKSSIFYFIWDKHDRIKRDTLIGKVEDGGIGLVDVELKLKAINASLTKRLEGQFCTLNRIVNG